ncbi:hypothetical protein BBJ28_00025289 [Nothophytophthora sp. Chile5]|nr:hypothetical protein BBJ28_00025289 [Nothophytophthora sp. Chile5]
MGKATEVAPPPPVMAEELPSAEPDTPEPSTLISLDQLEQLDAAVSAAERVACLQTALGVQHYPANARASVWVDFCFGVLSFARDDAQLSPDKSLCLLTLAHELYVFSTQPLVVPEAEATSTELAPSPSDEKVTTDANAVEIVAPTAAVAPPAGPADAYPSVEAAYDQFREKILAASGVTTTSIRSPTQQQSTPEAPLPPISPCTPFSTTEVAQIVTFFTSTFFRHLRAYQFLSRVARQSVVRETPLSVETPLPPAALATAILQTQ